MNDAPQGPGWWRAANGNWYPPNPHQRQPTIVPLAYRARPQPRPWPWFAVVAGMMCLVAIVALAAVVLLPRRDGAVSSPPVTSTPSTTSTRAETTTPAVTSPPAASSFVPPQGPAAGCPPSTPQDVAAVNAVLVPTTASGATGLTLGMASAMQVDDVRYIAGDVYDSSGVRLSVADVWAVVDGAVVATSGSAIELSTAPARVDLYPAPGEPGSELVTCRQIIPPTL